MRCSVCCPTFILVLLAAIAPSFAADSDRPFGLAPSAPPAENSSAAGTRGVAESPLIPETLTPPSRPLAKEDHHRGPNQTEVAENKLQQRIRLRAARSKAERDPGLQAISARALAARTDYEQRELYREYYGKLLDLIPRIDPRISKEDIAPLRAEYFGRFAQNHVRPTVPPDSR